ncbi:MTH1187 family thiamine-binding protein [Bacillus sp. A301a_S52]|nr:MTH1187 family thiamine-binding protein [Bacillus sp. A301a_S52]
MAIADVTIMPLGAGTTSVSDVVAEVHRLLKRSELPINYQLTPMSTILEGEVDDLYAILKQIQEVPFSLGHKRIAMNIRIDDRRDKMSSMKSKVAMVNKKLIDETD